MIVAAGRAAEGCRCVGRNAMVLGRRLLAGVPGTRADEARGWPALFLFFAQRAPPSSSPGHESSTRPAGETAGGECSTATSSVPWLTGCLLRPNWLEPPSERVRSGPAPETGCPRDVATLAASWAGPTCAQGCAGQVAATGDPRLANCKRNWRLPGRRGKPAPRDRRSGAACATSTATRKLGLQVSPRLSATPMGRTVEELAIRVFYPGRTAPPARHARLICRGPWL